MQNALIDFSKDKPEEVRGVGKHPLPVNWDALELVIRTTEGTELQKRIFRKRFLKAIRKNGVEAMTPWFRYHYVCARLYLGDYSDYWGWECRGLRADEESEEWAARLFWEETWLPKWGGGNVERLLVLGEQGIGDMIYAVSILPEALVRARQVIFECDPRLHGLVERAFGPRIICKGERPFEDRREAYGPIDAFVPAMDLMRMFRRDRKHFPGKPYFKPDPDRVAEMEPYRGRTGVQWKARQGALNLQSLGIDRPLSLQHGAHGEDIEAPHINLWSDIEGIVALCSVLSRVVCVPSSLHHMAGALGLRTQIICPEIASTEIAWKNLRWDYPVTAPQSLPWYGSAKVYENVAHWKKYCAGSSET